MTDPMQTEALMALVNEYGHCRWSEGSSGATHLDRLGERRSALEAADLYKEIEAALSRSASELRSLRDALALAKSRIAELEGALTPFAQFGKSDIWARTMWADMREDSQVIYSHATGKVITLGDFLHARAALKESSE